MLELIADLFAYQAWADSQLVAAVRSHPPAAEDEQLRTLLPEALPGVRTWLVQTVLHSQHHRGQVATRLRAFGGNPPTVDYILWARKRA